MGKVPKRCDDCKHRSTIFTINSITEMCDVIPDLTCYESRISLSLCSAKADWFEPKEDSK